MTATRFATSHNPFTGQSNIKIVPIPNIGFKTKGKTIYDEHFEKLLDFKQAMEIPEDHFHAVRKAMGRFLVYRGIRDKCSVRQMKHTHNKTYSLWLANKTPRSKQ